MDTVDDKDKLASNKMSSTEQSGNNNETNGAGTSTSPTSSSSSSSCGIVTSLFPTSCRGRAEAFARRLHRRLTNLGDIEGPTIPNDTKLNETTWLQKKPLILKHNNLQVLQCQPKYNHFNLNNETTTNNNKYENLLVNNTNNKQYNDDNNLKLDNNYSIKFDENTPDDNNSDIYYDIESSDNDKTNTDNYFDPLLTSESEFTNSDVNGYHDNIDDDTDKSDIVNNNKLNNESTDTSEILTNGYNNKKFIDINNSIPCCSDESSNDIKSSLETTSQSHESLWSDDNTLSLQDDNILTNDKINNNNKLINKTLISKSYSDSVLIPGTSGVIFNVDVINSNNFNKNNVKHENDNLLIDNPLKIDESIIQKNKKYLDDKLKGDSEPSLHVDDVTRLLHKLTCSPRTSFDENDVDNGDSGGSGDDDNDNIDHNDEENDDDDDEEEKEEEEEDRPMKLRRCSSLKTGKTPPGTPGTPGRKKIVRFADVLGLDLADVRTFLDEIPKIPNSAYSDLVYDDFFQKDTSPGIYSSSPTNNIIKLNNNNNNNTINNKILIPLFQNPNCNKNFIDIVKNNKVCLENIIINDPITLCIIGNVRVRNIDFHKSVYIRYTLDCWKSYSDLQALHVDGSCDGFSDKFTFKLYCHPLKIQQRLEFAIRFQCQGIQYWDNNYGVNYCFQCLSSTQANNYMASNVTCVNSTSTDYSPAFY